MTNGEILDAIRELKEEGKRAAEEEKRSRKWWLGPIISVLVIVTGIGVNYGVMDATISNVQAEQAKLQQQLDAWKIDVVNLKVKAGVKDEAVKNINDRLGRIESKLDDLAEKIP
jgi:uncharacterized protein YukE